MDLPSKAEKCWYFVHVFWNSQWFSVLHDNAKLHTQPPYLQHKSHVTPNKKKDVLKLLKYVYLNADEAAFYEEALANVCTNKSLQEEAETKFACPVTERRPRGRPKSTESLLASTSSATAPIPKRRPRGRPKGAKSSLPSTSSSTTAPVAKSTR